MSGPRGRLSRKKHGCGECDWSDRLSACRREKRERKREVCDVCAKSAMRIIDSGTAGELRARLSRKKHSSRAHNWNDRLSACRREKRERKRETCGVCANSAVRIVDGQTAGELRARLSRKKHSCGAHDWSDRLSACRREKRERNAKSAACARTLRAHRRRRNGRRAESSPLQKEAQPEPRWRGVLAALDTLTGAASFP
jgi:hypothetical protein